MFAEYISLASGTCSGSSSMSTPKSIVVSSITAFLALELSGARIDSYRINVLGMLSFPRYSCGSRTIAQRE